MADAQTKPWRGTPDVISTTTDAEESSSIDLYVQRDRKKCRTFALYIRPTSMKLYDKLNEPAHHKGNYKFPMESVKTLSEKVINCLDQIPVLRNIGRQLVKEGSFDTIEGNKELRYYSEDESDAQHDSLVQLCYERYYADEVTLKIKNLQPL